MLTQEIRAPRAWKRGDIGPKDWTVPLSSVCLAEMDRVVTALRRDPLPTLLLRPEQFAMPACAEAVRQVREHLRTGIGIAVLDRVPVERYALEENRALMWLLGCLLGRVVPTKWDGTMLYDVKDTGKSLEYGVRRSVTNLELTFHTDAAWMDCPPEHVGLYCMNRAQEGGVSRFVSLGSVHNELRRRHPDVLPRLYRPFPWDRQAEHAPDDPRTTRRPVFRLDDGRWSAVYNERLIRTGAELAGEPLDAEAEDALAAMDEIINAPALHIELTVEPGQERHLIRLWTREEGRLAFHA
jgi:hypothetical protein